jgi:signal transduction histidine kinase
MNSVRINLAKIINFFKSLFGPSRLRKKFLRFFFVVGLIPLIFMGLAGLYIVNQAHRIDVGTLEKQLIDFKTSEIQKSIGDIVGMFELRVSYENYAEIEISQQQFIADKMLEEKSALDEVVFVNVYGKETVKSFKDKNKEKILLDRSRSPEFITALEGKDYLGPTLYTQQGIIMPVASPVYNQKNQIIAVLTGKINLSSIQDLMVGTKLGNTGYLYVVDQNGTIIANSRETDIRKNVISQKIVADVLMGKERAGVGTDAVYNSNWNEQVIGSSYLIPKLNWGVIVEWPFDDAQKVVNLMAVQLTQFSLGTLILIFLLASLVALNLIKPISLLKEGAGMIGSGNFDYLIKIKTGDEIEELGYSLNKMAVSLKGLEELKEIKIKAKYLGESLKKEKELSNLKNQFITVASHQLNTPLAVINWSLETIKGSKATKKEVKDGIDAIDQSRRDILAMVTDLLTLSEIGFNYQKTKSEVTDLKELTKRVVDNYKSQLAAKDIKIVTESNIENTKADIGALGITKVVENLIDNAICYSNEKSKIKIEFSGNEDQLIFKVIDYGIGIPTQDQPSIFKEFFRAKNATVKKNVGTGLGLFISKNIIDGHGGAISFESEENKGSAFSFTIPRK